MWSLKTPARDDPAVIHRPAQILHPQEIKLLFESKHHVVITYMDLIGYRIPLSYPSDREHNQYRATSNLSLQAVQRIIAFSESVSREITEEFGIPRPTSTSHFLGSTLNHSHTANRKTVPFSGK